MKTILITGSGGMVGSAAANYYLNKNWSVIGVDNNMRKYFFGEDGDVKPVIKDLEKRKNYFHIEGDLTDEKFVNSLFVARKIDAVIHTAAQPSHDWAAKDPILDYKTNSSATMFLLDAVRRYSTDIPFIFTSTNKVYGDNPNKLSLVQYEKRFDYQDDAYLDGIDESMSIDQCLHSVFGASKASADIMCQEYGKYFDMPVAVFRGGCLTGPNHKAAELHGFLSYIVKCAVTKMPYTVFGYKGKQVRDQIHSSDILNAFNCYIENPVENGVVYNLGGTKDNSASIIEIVEILKNKGYNLYYSYKENNRIGDHIVYYTNMNKFKLHYPLWKIEWSLDDIIDELIEECKKEYKICD